MTPPHLRKRESGDNEPRDASEQHGSRIIALIRSDCPRPLTMTGKLLVALLPVGNRTALCRNPHWYRSATRRAPLLADAVLYAVRKGGHHRHLHGPPSWTDGPHVHPPTCSWCRQWTPVEFPNSDDHPAHVYSFSLSKAFQLSSLQGDARESVDLRQGRRDYLGCNIHDRMSAFSWWSTPPGFTRPAASGRILLEVLPTGTYAVRLW